MPKHAPLAGPEPWPTELRVSADRRTLTVRFEDGSAHALAAEYLRVESPSAEVQGHNPSEKRTVPGKREVTIRAVDPVGNYAVRITFSDGHDTGLFTWSYLARLGRDHATLWPAYLAALAAKGLSRDRA
ncbi:gamma-butyrobetaine hydroxylase-like domain-containing protein [Prosthecomicrobium pneumaticum]|uniref:gamma-butyrobetaine hydroxylase-like domain-containing protein n=1 Tax=Prosthecomicrobium pneumaticum TaxID=81895 RepID=UPI00161AE3F8|nr:DUF971 domain-containing protein [Prosthecomicrobium pneumaticum]